MCKLHALVIQLGLGCSCGLVEGDATYIDVFRRCQEDCIGFSTLAGGGDTLQEVKDGFDYCKKSSIKNCGLSHF
uniref:4-hydroxy-2-oxovalerate aldolase n=1 Tax=Echinococcus granulosus TaxID=6210 RepID=U6FQU5_ECHGR|nr:hypothetical protein EgrG_002070500 [Echinococcus granulosus]